MSTDRWVRVMADEASEGLWDHEGEMMLRSDLPISPSLAKRHKRWCDWYDFTDIINLDFDYVRFSEEGREIAEAIKRELPDWTVIYFDEYKCLSINCSEQAPRQIYEYEIMAPAE